MPDALLAGLTTMRLAKLSLDVRDGVHRHAGDGGSFADRNGESLPDGMLKSGIQSDISLSKNRTPRISGGGYRERGARPSCAYPLIYHEPKNIL